MEAQASRGLLDHLARVPDPRASNVSHSLLNLLVMTLLAVLCRCDDYEEIAAWADVHADWLGTFLDLPHGTPSHDTFDRVLSRLDPLALERCFIVFTQGVAEASAQTPGSASGGRRLVAVDGKSLRRSFDAGGRKAAVHMVNAWDRQNQLVLGQLATDRKSNEITAIRRLLELLDLRGCVVSIDAPRKMGCQKATAASILGHKADYLLAVKANHKTLHEDVKLFFDDGIAQGWEGVEVQQVKTIDGEHGRIETRQLWASHDVGWLKRQGHDWPGLGGLVCVQSQRQVLGRDAQTRTQRRYYLTSLDPRRVGADRLLEAVRGHWGIENKVHWSLDVTFREDDSRVRKANGPQNLARLRRLAMNLLRPRPSLLDKPGKPPKNTSLKRKRLMCSRDRDYLLATLSGTSHMR